MATKAWISKQKRREALVTRFAEVRRKLKKEKNYAALANLPRDSSPTRSHTRCELTGRSHGDAPQVQGLPDHAPGVGPGRQNPGAQEGKLVSEEMLNDECRLLNGKLR